MSSQILTNNASGAAKSSAGFDVMRTRWLKSNKWLPYADIYDLMTEDPIANGGKIIPLDKRSQPHAEFTQSGYLRIRNQEE